MYRPVPPGDGFSLYSVELMREHVFRKLRKSMGLTQAQMAGLLRVPVVTVRAREAGRLPDRPQRPVRVKRTGSKN